VNQYPIPISSRQSPPRPPPKNVRPSPPPHLRAGNWFPPPPPPPPPYWLLRQALPVPPNRFFSSHSGLRPKPLAERIARPISLEATFGPWGSPPSSPPRSTLWSPPPPLRTIFRVPRFSPAIVCGILPPPRVVCFLRPSQIIPPSLPREKGGFE